MCTRTKGEIFVLPFEAGRGKKTSFSLSLYGCVDLLEYAFFEGVFEMGSSCV